MPQQAMQACLIYSVGGADVGPEVGFLYTYKSTKVGGGGLCLLETVRHVSHGKL